MKKNNAGGLLIVLAIILTAAVVIGLYTFLNTQKTTAYLFNDDYPAGTPITADMLTAVEVDRTMYADSVGVAVSSQYVTKDNVVEAIKAASVLKVDVYKGTALMKSYLSNLGATRAELNMKPDAIAVTVGVNSVTAGSVDISIGTYVNVYANYTINRKNVTYLTVQGARVIDVRGSTETGQPETVTLELDQQQALKVVNAMQFGKIQLAVIDKNGYQYITDTQMPSYEIEADSFTDAPAPVTVEGQ